MAVLRTCIGVLILSVFLCVVAQAAVAGRGNRHLSRNAAAAHSHNEAGRGAILRRFHRQTPSEDSYEDVVEYEYEDEVGPTEATADNKKPDDTRPEADSNKKEQLEPEPAEDEVEGGKKPDATNNEEGDEYYDAYDETPGENGANNGGDEEGGKVEEDEEETDVRERDRQRPRTDDDDADEDSAEREDRLEEERRQAEIREQERLEEERREEERREYQRRQEAAEEDEEEDTEEDFRRRQEEERIRAEANRSEEEPEEREPPEQRRSDDVPDHDHDHDERLRESEEREDEHEMDHRRVWLVSTTESTTMTTPVTTPQSQPEAEEVEYEEEDVQETVPELQQETTQQPAPIPREFEEERRHHHIDEEGQDREEEDTDREEEDSDREEEDSGREEFVESDLNGEYGPAKSSEMRPTTFPVTQAPILIEESGREDLERYTYDRRPEPPEPEEGQEEEEEVVEEEYDQRGRYETTPRPTYRPNYAPEHETGEYERPEESDEEEHETEGTHRTQPPPRAEIESEEETRLRFVPVSVPTTEKTWPHYHHVVPTTQRTRVEDDYARHRHPVPYDDEKEIDESIDEDVDEHELRTTTTEPPTEEPVEEDRELEREDDRTNQIHQETTDEHHEPRLREDEDDDEGLGFYEGRRFNEESRQRQDEDEDEEMNAVGGHDVTHRKPVVVANLDLSREPDEDDHDIDADIDDAVIEQSTTLTTSTSTTTPRPDVRYPDRFNNRIDDGDRESERDSDEDERSNSFYDINHNYYGHGRTRPPQTHRPGPAYEDGGRRPDNAVVVDYNVNRFGETPTRIECFSGYHLSEDGTECLDVDECSQNVCGSTQICLNTPGSYRCTCNLGYVKDFRNELLCRDINECEIGNGGCGHDCVNTQGSYYCSCSEGYDLARDGRNCNMRPTTPTTTTTSTTTMTTTTTTPPPPQPTIRPSQSYTTLKPTTPLSVITPDGTRISNCPTPPVPRGSGIAYLYCSRSPVGIHHRHSQLERRLLQDWAARRSRYNTSERVNSRFRLRRTLKRRRHPRQTTYSPGSMCELRCRAGFELKGQYTLHCNATSGLWQGTTTGFCQTIPKADNRNIAISVSSSEATPNEIPRLHPGPEITVPDGDRESSTNDNRRPFKPSFRPSSVEIPAAGLGGATSFRPNFYQLPVSITTTSRGLVVFTPPPPATRLTPNHIWSDTKHKPSTPPSTTTTITTTGRPYYHYYSPVTPFRPLIIPSTTTTSTTTPAPTTRNSFIHLTYRFKTPWIKCPDDIKIDLQPGQRLAYVIIPQPQTNVDWWRQVTSEPSWAKGLETEIGPGKQKIVFRARTPAPLNNSAECSFVLEIRDIEPPTIRDCPESFSVRLSPGQSARAVTWVEPHFSDNVRVQTIKKSREPGLIMTAGEHVVNYEVSDSSNNRAKCTFTIQVVASPVSDSRFSTQNNLYRRPAGTEPITTTTLNPIKTDIHSTIKNVVCHVGKKGRRIVFQSRVVPRGCTEMPLDVASDSSGMLQNGAGQYNTLNTLVQNSAENSATSQISSVSFSSNDHPQSASAFGQAISNGRHSNRLVHSTSVVTNGAQGTSSRASSYALSSSRNFDTPFLIAADKQVYDEDFVVPSSVGPKTRVSNGWGGRVDDDHEPRDFVRSGSYGRERHLGPEIKAATPSQSNPRNSSSNGRNHQEPNQQEQTPEYRKYFRHFDSWDSTGNRL